MCLCELSFAGVHGTYELRGIIDPSGVQGNMGLLQIRTETGFGTVCGLNHGAADLICRTMGYDHGTTGSNPCSSYGGTNVCGELGSPVAMKALSCNSGNLTLDGLINAIC